MPCTAGSDGECAGVGQDVCAAAYKREGGLGEAQVEADLETEVEAVQSGGEGWGEGMSGFGGAMWVSVYI